MTREDEIRIAQGGSVPEAPDTDKVYFEDLDERAQEIMLDLLASIIQN
ncbi:MAG: hypothetical protein ACOC1Q_00540 [Desulfosalsimonas sp.]